MLRAIPGLRPITVLREMQRRHAGFSDDLRRTLERRVRLWQALHGPERDVTSGRNTRPVSKVCRTSPTLRNSACRSLTCGSSTGCTTPPSVLWLGARAGGAGRREFRCLGRGVAERALGLGWRTRGASQRQSLGGIPQSGTGRRGGSDTPLRGIVRALRHDADTRHPGVAHENGSIEGPHAHLKMALQQALLLRGSGDFADLNAYRRFVDEVVGRANAGRRKALEIERARLNALPVRRTDDFEEELVTVTRSGGFFLRRIFYTVPSRLIGHRLRVRLYDDRLECFLGGTQVLVLRRGHAGKDSGRRGHVVDYHHVIHALRRKPMALLNLVYRDQLFPREAYRHSWEALLAALPPRTACRTMVGLLALAHDRTCEGELAIELEAILGTGELPDLALLRQQFAPPGTVVPTVTVTLPAAITYDALLGSLQEWLRP